MAKRAKAELLILENLGDLQGYDDDELARLRETLIADVERIQAESAEHAKHISELNQARNDLQRERAERARTLRAVKHTLVQRAYAESTRGERVRSLSLRTTAER